jgi:hypothetical protein
MGSALNMGFMGNTDPATRLPSDKGAAPEDFVRDLKQRQRAGSIVARKSRRDFFKPEAPAAPAPSLGGGAGGNSKLGG